MQIHSLNVVEYQYPELILDVECGSGTYIRSLGRDLSESLGTAAVMSALERTAIGPFNIDTACDPRDLPAEKISAVLQPPESALTDIPQITLSNVEIEDIARGRYIVAPTIAEVRGYACEGLELFTALDERGTMVALMRRRSETKLGPYISFVAIS